jgi:P pilus assembly chaperone PapD
MSLRLRSLAIAIALLIGMPTAAQAQIAVSRLLIDVIPGNEREDIVVSNNGEDVAYVQITIREYLNPGTDEEELVERDSPRELGLLASPNRMILQPGEKAILRLGVIERPTDIDRVFKISVTPVVGEIESSTNAIKLVYAFGVIVILRTETPEPSVTVTRDGNILTVVNDGNTMVQFGYGKQCDASGVECTEIPNKRVYPDSTWVYELPEDAPVTFEVKTLEVVEVQTF